MLIDCRALARQVDEETRACVERLDEKGIKPVIVEIIATEDGAVLSYSRTKAKKAASLGVDYRALEIPDSETSAAIIDRIAKMNENPLIHGIMIGMPVYKHLESDAIIAEVVSYKDVDGLGPMNTAFVATNQEALAIAPATARAAIRIAESQTELKGKRVAVLGRGRTVGRPVANMATNRDATVTLCHSRTKDLADVVRASEVVVAATGRPHGFDAAWLGPQHSLVDCGISFIDGKTVGDFESEAASATGARVAPVPGGVGTVTNAMIFANLLSAMQLQGHDLS